MRVPAVVAFVVAACVSSAAGTARKAHAEDATPPERRAANAWVFETRVARGIDMVRRLTLLVEGVGLDHELVPSLRVQAMALVLVPIGTSDLGDASPGAGGELSLRVVPWPDGVVRPYAHASLGLLGFPSPFLPGAAHYEGIVSFGFGALVAVRAGWTLGANVHYVHLSNGQGLGPHNPAFDGFGVGLDARYALSTAAAPSTSPHDDRVDGRETWLPGGSLDASLGAFEDAILATGRVQLVERVAPWLLAQLDVEAGTFASERLVELGGALVAHTTPLSVGMYVAHRWFGSLTVPTATAQAEVHLTREVSLVAFGQWERPFPRVDVGRAAIGVRAFPLDHLMLDLGVAFDDTEGDGQAPGSDPYLCAEWQPPIALEPLAVSIFVERQISGLSLAGIRVRASAGPTIRDAARHDAWRRLR